MSRPASQVTLTTGTRGSVCVRSGLSASWRRGQLPAASAPARLVSPPAAPPAVAGDPWDVLGELGIDEEYIELGLAMIGLLGT